NPNNSCRFCPDWRCAGLAAVARTVGPWPLREVFASTALLLTGRHAQTPTVLDYSRTLPQGDGCAGPAFAGGAVGSECNLIVFDACDVLDDAFAVRGPGIDAERKVSSRRGHVRLFLPQSSSASRFTAGAFGFFILSQSGERPER